MELVERRPARVHAFICVNERDAPSPSCGPDMSGFRELKRWVWESYGDAVRLTKTGCLGVCPARGFTLLLHPSQRYHIIDGIDEAKRLIEEAAS